jgi:ATP synthase protein I
MPEFVDMYNRARKWMFYLLAIYVLGWGFTSYKAIFMGLVLGTACSLINLLMLFRRMGKFDKSITNGKKVHSVGSMSRLAMASLAAVIALRWPQFFNIIFVIVGLMTNYIVIMIDYLIHYLNVNKLKKKER